MKARTAMTFLYPQEREQTPDHACPQTAQGVSYHLAARGSFLLSEVLTFIPASEGPLSSGRS